MAANDAIRRWFRSVDVDNSGSINTAELQRALEAGNLFFPPTVVAQMTKMYDRDNSGTMSFDEFVSLHKFLSGVQDTFTRNSRNRRDLSLQEMFPALQQAGYKLDQPSFFTVCRSFDKGNLGSFKLDEFMSICIFLQSAQNLFTAFDSQRKGQVVLDYNQFVYCSANLRL